MKSHSPVPKTVRKLEVHLAFPEAIRALIGGKKIRRIEWADEGEHGVLKDSFLMIFHHGKYHTWILSEGDLLATDWVVTK